MNNFKKLRYFLYFSEILLNFSNILNFFENLIL